MTLKEYAHNNILIIDGAMGTVLQNNGLKAGESPEMLNLTNPELVKHVHKEYLQAGTKMILTNTFGANGRKLSGQDADRVVQSAVEIARSAAAEFNAYTALDIGPLGELLEPLGTLKFDEAYEIFKKQVISGVKAGAQAVYIETMTDLYEAKCAVLAAKENSDLPVFCTMSFEKNMRTFTGAGIASMALTLQGLGVDYLGINCSVGPDEARAMIKELIKWTHLPIVVKPNAGLPEFVNGDTVFNVGPEEFATKMKSVLDLGAAAVGGCCGTTPDFIKSLAGVVKDMKHIHREPINVSAVCSSSKTVVIDKVRIIGERINPTGKKVFQEAVRNNNMEYIAVQAIEQTDAGADILDVNVGVPGIDESSVMSKAIKNIQSVVSVPLQIDSSNPDTIEAGLRAYSGKAIVNSVSGEESSLRRILPLVKKYGAAVVGLTLDEKGIPKTAEERFVIAEKIVKTAESYGIPKSDVFIDCLTLTAGAEQPIAYESLNALKLIKEKLNVKTVLGVSNISFGLPARSQLNRTFLTLAMANGLDMPIIDPNNDAMTDAVYCYHQLKNIDEGSTEYIKRFGEIKETVATTKKTNDILHCVESGLKEEIKTSVKELLSNHEPLIVVQKFLIPALDIVGKRYELGEIFLPQLLSSAEAAKTAFDIVKQKMPAGDKAFAKKIILATVKGDIHDIGKNIVNAVLENYGYTVIDLGKDVEIEEVAKQALSNEVKLVGLSALMTTTVENMKKTIQAIKEADASIVVMVGGAVLTEKYAKEIGADYYAKDALAAVNIAKECFVEN